MKAYKAMNKDLTCLGFQFKEGETYSVDGPPVLCKYGFHFCTDLVLTLAYYPVTEITDNAYAEVEILGDTEYEQPTKHKGVTNKIKILRVLSDDEVLALVDSRNNSGYWNSGSENSGYWNSGSENSGSGNSGSGNSGNGNSGSRNSGYWNSGSGNSGNGNSGSENSGYWNSGSENSGSRNSGNGNSGSRNSGNGNSGNWNSGSRNSGYWNSGSGNSGYWNSGSGNSGNGNSGSENSGSRNSGNWNSGSRNSGNWNACSDESGYFNTAASEYINVFNKPCLRTVWERACIPSFLHFALNPELGYKASFQKAYAAASEEEKAMLKALPNFDAEVFYELSGIRVD